MNLTLSERLALQTVVSMRAEYESTQRELIGALEETYNLPPGSIGTTHDIQVNGKDARIIERPKE